MLRRLLKSREEETFADAVSTLSFSGASELSAEQVLHRQLSGVEELDAQPKETSHSTSQCSSEPQFPLHRAAFEGDVAALKRLLPQLSQDERLALDPQGNTALHVAVLRRNTEAVAALLDAGCPADFKNRQRWTSIDEAVAMQDAALAKQLYTWLVEDTKRQMKEKKGRLLEVLREMPDFTMQLRWELGSPIFGLLLRRFAPDDTYTLRKAGTRLRVDGSLMGADHEAHSLLPTWKRGSFSLLVDAAPTPASILFVDHGRRVWVDLTEERKSKPRDLDAEVQELLQDGASKVKWDSRDLAFQQSRTWLGRPATEKVEGWSTQVYECSGKLVAVAHRKPPVRLPETATWPDYLALPLPEDEREVFPIDPLAGPPGLKPGGGGGRGEGPGSPCDSVDEMEGGHAGGKAKRHHHHQQQQPRKFGGKCWMAKDFPMSLAQLLPLLEVVGYANKHVARAAAFIQRFATNNLFPVRVQVPLAWTVYLLVGFRHFRVLAPGEAGPELFQPPPGFSKVTLQELAPPGEGRAGSGLDLGAEIQF